MSEKIEAAVSTILSAVGEDPEREGLLRTPHRVAKAYSFLTNGYRANIDDIVNEAIFHEECNEMVVLRNIEFYSLCEHHMLPFYGKAHVAYLPKGKIIGLSKVPRIVDMFSRRLQIQERLTAEIARAIKNEVNAEGVGVVMECQHLCMMMRGVEKQNSVMMTSSVLGSFHDDAPTRSEFLDLVRT